MDIEKIYETIDHLFEENKVKEAEQYMLQLLSEGMEKEQSDLVLVIVNELIGFYRQASKKEELLHMIEQAKQVAHKMQIEETIPYATTMLNIATGYRSMNMLDEAFDCYTVTEHIYAKQLADDDMLYAGLYNNISLLYQEQKQYEKALEYQKKALTIALYREESFEIAVTYTNMANTYLALQEKSLANQYAQLAIEKYKERNIMDPHFSAALNVLGVLAYEAGESKKAKEIFAQGMEIIKQTIGENEQYRRMKEYYDLCEGTDDFINGRTLCRQYYEEYGKPMLEKAFSEYMDKIAVGLVGEGSDCYGFDDETSVDHDWGPGFCIWVTDQTYEAIGKQLQESYEKLPKTYKGYERKASVQGRNRTGVIKISDFFASVCDKDGTLCVDYRQTEDYNLACLTNGEIFYDGEGIFTKIYKELKKGYPSSVRYLKLAEAMTLFSQCGQYNYERMLRRKDLISADKMLMDGIYQAMRLQHYLCNVYPPHEKWLVRSTGRLENGTVIMQWVEDIHSCIGNYDENAAEKVKTLFEKLGTYFARTLYEKNIISDINPYLAYHQDELLYKAQFVECDCDTLCNKIAKIEFQAFDKVRNEGGRASCQNDWPTFYVMRKSQYLTWTKPMLIQYLYDFQRELSYGHNLITEKYGRMMESTAPEEYEKIKDKFPVIGEAKKAIIEQIVALQMEMMEQFAVEHERVAKQARSLHTYEDNFMNTSYETYLRGEISTYSDKMLQLYGQYVVAKVSAGENIARLTIENTAKLYGYKDIEEFEAREEND